jgi:hypothetical protein
MRFMVATRAQDQLIDQRLLVLRTQIAPRPRSRAKYTARLGMCGANMTIIHAKIRAPRILLAQKCQHLKFMMIVLQMKFAATEHAF